MPTKFIYFTHLILLFACKPVFANSHADRIKYRGIEYDLVYVNPPYTDLTLHWKDSKNNRIASFTQLKNLFTKQNRKLMFATNAGIFAPGYRPLGLHVERSKQLAPINRKKGHGNFYVKPNGVFYITNASKAGIADTTKILKKNHTFRLATQSGPMLVFNNRIHWLFKRKAVSRYIRNGVGINHRGQIIIAISNSPVNFYQFAAFFRYRLKCPTALYLDGSISKMYNPIINRHQLGGNFAGILAISKPN